MAIAGTWKRQAQSTVDYEGAKVWGTGINPIHSQHDDGTGRVIAPMTYEPGNDDPGIDYGYCFEDMVGGVAPAYMNDHPNWGSKDTRSNTGDYPRWGMDGNEYPLDPVASPPMGTGIRAYNHGFLTRLTRPLQVPSETVTEGYRHKEHGGVSDSRVSDDSQYTINTSMRQRDLSRNNEHAVTRGTDDPREPIKSRITGKRRYVPSSSPERHYDMTPREQDYILRPFVTRTAGTAPEQWLEGQEMFVQEPIQRQPPSDPFLGENAIDLPIQQETYGFTGEDMSYV